MRNSQRDYSRTLAPHEEQDHVNDSDFEGRSHPHADANLPIQPTTGWATLGKYPASGLSLQQQAMPYIHNQVPSPDKNNKMYNSISGFKSRHLEVISEDEGAM